MRLRGLSSVGTRTCEVTERGRPMPLGQVPSPDPPAVDPPAPLPEGGFGWHIVRCLVSDLRYERRGDTNRLLLTLSLSAAA